MQREERSWMIAWAAGQGAGLWLLHEWLLSLSKQGEYFWLIWPLYMAVLLLPLSMMLLSAYRQQKRLWPMVTAYVVLIAGLASYLGYQAWTPALDTFQYAQSGVCLALVGFGSWFVLLPFAEHRLLRQRWADDYALLFAAAWRNSIKLALAGGFTGLLWLLLLLFANLLKVLGVTYLLDLLGKPIFFYPVTAVTFGIGLSLYAAKEEVLVGFYRAGLNIAGWLLPVVSLILLAFLLVLPVQGLDKLWDTGYASSLMLSLLGLTVFLFNAAWQDASGQQRFPPWLLRFIGLGLLTMPVYIGLCVYALGLRVAQYGWTTERVFAALVILVMAMYALGYAAVVLRREKLWMNSVSKVNIATALLTVLLGILTCSPLLDPTRIAVHSQLARLLQQKVKVRDFDFEYLRFQAGRYGDAALTRLDQEQTHPDAVELRRKAKLAHALTQRQYKPEAVKLGAEELRQLFKIYPQQAQLPQAFVDALRISLEDNKVFLGCEKKRPCAVLLLDLNADGVEELVLLDGFRSLVYGLEGGQWKKVGTLLGETYKLNEKSVEDALTTGNFSSKPTHWQDLQIGDMQFKVQEE